MKLPRKITISGRVYDVKRDRSKGTGYGRGRLDTGVITVGSDGSKEQGFETFIHEVMEVALLEENLRYDRDGTNDFNYQMTHTEFDGYSKSVSRALMPMLKGQE